MRNYDIRNPTQPKKEPTPSASAREKATIALVSDLITAEDIDNVLTMLRGALRAEVSMRAPRKTVEAEGKKTTEPNNYLIAADWPVRLAAGKMLLAYKAGNPVDTLSMQLGLKDRDANGAQPQTTEEMVEQLRATGTDLGAILGTWFAGMKVAEKAEPGAEIVTITETPVQLPVVDV